jgi:hypothetical protein
MILQLETRPAMRDVVRRLVERRSPQLVMGGREPHWEPHGRARLAVGPVVSIRSVEIYGRTRYLPIPVLTC